jgi:LacI family transcriptional regulator, galactose operon repressor
MGRFLRQAHPKILVLAGSMLARDHAERRLGFDQIMAEKFLQITVLPSVEIWDDAETTLRLLPRIFEDNPDIGGIYSLGGGNSGLVRALKDKRMAGSCVVIVHELTATSKTALEQGVFDAVIAQDFGHVVRSSIRMLRAKSDGLDTIPSQERIRIDVILKENLV